MNRFPNAADLKRLSPDELERLGQDSLAEHLVAQAVVAHARYGPITAANLEQFLQDPECTRFPVRLVFEFGEMALHQFAHPEIDWRNPERDGRVLYLRPWFRGRPDLVPLAVAYMLPAINYGKVISDDHCLAYGATLLGLLQEEFYRQVCAMADLCGAESAPAAGSFSLDKACCAQAE